MSQCCYTVKQSLLVNKKSYICCEKKKKKLLYNTFFFYWICNNFLINAFSIPTVSCNCLKKKHPAEGKQRWPCQKPGDGPTCGTRTGPQQSLAEPVLCFLLVNYAGMFDCIVPDKCSLQAKHKGSESLGEGSRKSSKHIEFLSNMLQIPLQRKLEHSNRKLMVEATWHITKEKRNFHLFFSQDSQINN